MRDRTGGRPANVVGNGKKTEQGNGLVRFGKFEFDSSSRVLRCGDKRRRIAPKPAQVLEFLLERPGKIVTREEFCERLWGNSTFVEYDDGLNHAVRRLREVLGEAAEQPVFIETVPGVGYRFIAPVTAGRRPYPNVVLASRRAGDWFRRSGPLLAGLALIAMVTSWSIWRWPARSRRVRSDSGAMIPDRSTIRFDLPLPEKQRLHHMFRTGLAVSADGKMLAFVSRTDPLDDSRDETRVRPPSQTGSSIFIHRMDQLTARPIRGTESNVMGMGPYNPVFSPDSQWIAFGMTDERGYSLRKVSVSGESEPLEVCKCRADHGISWGDDGQIVFAGPQTGLQRVDADGGEPVGLTELDIERGEVSHRLPFVLPGARAVLFTAVRYQTWVPENFEIHVVSLTTGERRTLMPNGTDARYVPSGHMVFAREGSLWATAFDLATLQPGKQPVPVLQGVNHAMDGPRRQWRTGASQISFSKNGVLVYAPGSVYPEEKHELVWVNRQGEEEVFAADQKHYFAVRLSPDGTKVLFTTNYPPKTVGVYDVRRKTMRRQTFEGPTQWAIWGPRADQITFASGPSGWERIYWKKLDSGPGHKSEIIRRAQVGSWNPDGTTLASVRLGGYPSCDIWTIAGGEAKPFLDTKFMEDYPEFSPDGKWLAYTSDDSGTRDVYIRPYPEKTPLWQVSTGGGFAPAWSRDGTEIFYRKGNKFMASTIEEEAGKLVVGKPLELFEGQYDSAWPVRAYDVALDGRFLLVRRVKENSRRVFEQTHPNRLRGVTNWFKELRRKVPTGN